MLHPLIFVVRWFQGEKRDALFSHCFPYGSPGIPFVSENRDAVQTIRQMIQSFAVIFVGFSDDISGDIPVNGGQNMNFVTVISLLFGRASAVSRSFIPKTFTEIRSSELADRQRIAVRDIVLRTCLVSF